MSTLRYSARASDCTVLGPGCRAVIWVHGCFRDCPGCIAQNFKNGDWQEVSAEAMADWVLEQQNTDGLTISGGEPMLQAGALADMLEQIRRVRDRDVGVIVYTGFTIEELRQKATADQDRFLRQIDLLVDGPFIQALNHDQPYRGSANQRFITLTQRYRDAIEAADGYYNRAAGRRIEIGLTENGTLMEGVPSKAQAAVWQKIKHLAEGGV